MPNAKIYQGIYFAEKLYAKLYRGYNFAGRYISACYSGTPPPQIRQCKPYYADPSEQYLENKRAFNEAIRYTVKAYSNIAAINMDNIRPDNLNLFDQQGYLSGYGYAGIWKNLSQIIEIRDQDRLMT